MNPERPHPPELGSSASKPDPKKEAPAWPDPRGGVPEEKLYSTKVRRTDSGDLPVSVRTPDGSFALQPGEELVMVGDAGARQPFIKQGEELVPLQDYLSKTMETDPGAAINRALLKKLTLEAGSGSKLYGKDFELKPDQRQELLKVADIVDMFFAGTMNSDDWREFQKILKDGTAKGVLLSFSPKSDGAPIWLLDGGATASVEKTMRANARGELRVPSIQVPTEVYDAYRFTNTAKKVRQEAERSAEDANGRSAHPLADDLRRLSSFFREQGLL